MGVEYYMFAPKDNVIYDVGKMHNWENFKPLLTGAHREWVLIHENYYNWYDNDEQSIEVASMSDRHCITINLKIPANVEKRDCFSDEFQKVLQSWSEIEAKRQEKLRKWREEDRRIAEQTPEEKKEIVDAIMRELYPGGER